MHSFTGKNGTIFRFNGDYSGDIICQRGNLQFKVDGEDFIEFAEQATVSEIIKALEDKFC